MNSFIFDGRVSIRVFRRANLSKSWKYRNAYLFTSYHGVAADQDFHKSGVSTEDSPCERSHDWNLAVASGVSAVHDTGQPIIHSSKLGERTLRSSVPRNMLDEPPHSLIAPTP